jgi:hypothetical protein
LKRSGFQPRREAPHINSGFSRTQLPSELPRTIGASALATIGVKSSQNLPSGDVMKRIALFLLLLAFCAGYSLPAGAEAQNARTKNNFRLAKKAAKQNRKAMNKVAKKQKKAMKKYQKQQRKAAKAQKHH